MVKLSHMSTNALNNEDGNQPTNLPQPTMKIKPTHTTNIVFFILHLNAETIFVQPYPLTLLQL